MKKSLILGIGLFLSVLCMAQSKITFGYDVKGNMTSIKDADANSCTNSARNRALESAKIINSGSNAEIKESKLVLSPNPAVNFVKIQYQTSKKTPSRLIILDLNGRITKQIMLRSESLELDISTLPSGLYFVKLQTDEGVKSVKLVKTGT